MDIGNIKNTKYYLKYKDGVKIPEGFRSIESDEEGIFIQNKQSDII